MEDLMKSFEKYLDISKEIRQLFNAELYKKEYADQNMRIVEGEKFVCRDYLSDWYSQLTEEQKKLIAKFQVVYGSALVEDKHDRQYNLKNYEEMNNNLSMKGGIVIGK
jgi:hypothetical protein